MNKESILYYMKEVVICNGNFIVDNTYTIRDSNTGRGYVFRLMGSDNIWMSLQNTIDTFYHEVSFASTSVMHGAPNQIDQIDQIDRIYTILTNEEVFLDSL